MTKAEQTRLWAWRAAENSLVNRNRESAWQTLGVGGTSSARASLDGEQQEVRSEPS